MLPGILFYTGSAPQAPVTSNPGQRSMLAPWIGGAATNPGTGGGVGCTQAFQLNAFQHDAFQVCVVPQNVGWPIAYQTPEEAEAEWRDSHRHRFNRKSFEDLKEAERAATANANASRSEPKKEALEEAISAVAEIPETAPDADLQHIAALLTAAANAVTVKKTISRAEATAVFAKELRRKIDEENDEEESIMLLLH